MQEEPIILRDPKAKLITLEKLSIHRFSVSCSGFPMPEDVVSIIKKYGGTYSTDFKEWVISI